MISGSNYKKKILRPKSFHQKIEEKSQKEARSMVDSVTSQKSKVKTREEREKPVVKEHIKKLGVIKVNEIKKDSSENQSSSMFSRTNGRFKISIKNSKEYFSKVNSNGFSTCPPTLIQLLPPFLIITFMTEIIVISLHFLVDYQMYIIWSVMAFLIIPTCYFWYVTTSISPTDSIQLQHLKYIEDPMGSSFEPEKHKYFCNLCKTCISHQSFHCNKCNRCVEYFDHHCKWLNNCIGAKNYLEFIQLVVWSQIFMLFFYVVNFIVIAKIESDEDHLPGLLWLAISTMVISLVPFVAISILLFLHLYLIIAKRTTIQLILENRKQNKIYPQNLNGCLTQKRQYGYKVRTIPEESPINSPTFFQKEFPVLKDLSNQQNDSRLKKFVTNLRNNLELSKKSFKENQQTSDTFAETKISFKHTIFKKSTSFGRAEFKNNSANEKSNQQYEVEQGKQAISKAHSKKNENNQDLINESKLSEQIEDIFTTNNLLSRLRFSTKNQILDGQQETKTSRFSGRECRKSQTQRSDYDQREKKNPKKLEPLPKNQTQRKIKFETKIETFNKENISIQKEDPNLNFKEGNCHLNDRNEQKVDRSFEKPKSTRIFQVFSSLSNYEEQI